MSEKKLSAVRRPGTRRFFLKSALAAGAAGALGDRLNAAYTPVLPGGALGAIKPPKRHGGSKLKVSCCAYSLRRYLGGSSPSMTMEDFLKWAVDAGLEAVELTSYFFPPDADREYFHDIKRRAFLLGLDVSGTAVGNNFCQRDSKKREQQVNMVKKWVDNAVYMGAPCIRIFAGRKPGGVSTEQAVDWAAECIEKSCEYAGKHGVMLALENHGGITSDAEGVLSIVKKVKSPWFGLNFDSGNFHTGDPYEDMAEIAPYAVTAHVKASVHPRGEKRQRADFKRICKILRNSGYRGYVSVEYEEGGDVKAEAARYVKVLQEAASETS